MRNFRFGVSAFSAASAGAWRTLARDVEDTGIDVFSVPDHIGELYSPFEALMAAAAATERIRLSTLVLNNDFRHPAIVARQAAMIQEFSEGRFELGIGAGHAQPEYEGLGLPFDSANVRVKRLNEAAVVIRGLFAGETVSFRGEHYNLANHRLFPLPAKPVPLLIGGNGRGLLRLAAERADIVGFTGLGETLPDGQRHATSGFAPSQVDGRLALVREAAGSRFDGLELNVLVQVVHVTSDREATARDMARRMPGLNIEDILSTPYLLFGTPVQMAGQIRQARERWGFSYFSTFLQNLEAMAQVIALLR